MNATQTIEAINEHLDSTPFDFVARLELADLYEEQGIRSISMLPALQRWMAANEKFPAHIVTRVACYWRWCDEIDAIIRKSPFAKIARKGSPAGYYRTRKDAEMAAAIALRAIGRLGNA